MREILFRGKHIHALKQNKHLDGRWIEGYLCDENRINSPELGGGFLVDPETIGQYTGFKDVNERKIFEGDIVRTDTDEESLLVRWDEENAEFLLESDGFEEGFGSYWGWQLEVVGNISDNPELWKG